MKCTWKDCRKEAKHPQVGKTGVEWANLCNEHNKELDEDISALFSPKKVLKDWVLAHGGAKNMKEE